MLGGGPAGASAARLLATWGHAVHIVTRAADDRPLGVSLPPSCAKLFDAIGAGDAVERAGFVRSTGNTVWWGGEARVEPFAGGARGWQVDVRALEAVLLGEAARAGATIERRVLASSERGDSERRGGPSGPPTPFVLDCTGRSGVLARARDLRCYDAGPRTVALVGEWRVAGAFDVPDDTHTLVESYAGGWMWSVPTAPGIRHVSAMVDPQRSDLARGGPSRDVYLSEIGKTRAFQRLLAGASLAAGPWGWDASTYSAHHYAGDGWLLAGDAGSFIDPLSSAGVKKALASGWLAAITVHTCLSTPGMRDHALRFYDAREREIARHHTDAARAFLSAAARGHDHPFWEIRAADEPDGGVGEVVRQAFDRLKEAPELRVRAGWPVAPRPVVTGQLLQLAPHLVLGPDDPGVRYLYGINLVALVELAPAVSQVPELFDAYQRREGPASLHDFLMALSTAIARGILVAQ